MVWDMLCSFFIGVMLLFFSGHFVRDISSKYRIKQCCDGIKEDDVPP
jgi:hypothetical protein